jgi:hypothetical protein
MRGKEPKAALREISAVLREPRLNPDHRDQLLKAKRDLEKIARSGKLDRRKLFRIVEVVSIVLLEIVED